MMAVDCIEGQRAAESRREKSPCVRTRFGSSVENERAGAGRDGRTLLTRPDSQVRTCTFETIYFSRFSSPRAGLVTMTGRSRLS